MKTQLLCALAIAAGVPLAAAAEGIEYSREAYLGWGNTGDHDGPLAIGTLDATTGFQLGGLAGLTLHGRVRLRTDHADLGYVDNDPLDLEAIFDFGRAGKLTVSTFSLYDGYPWVTGDIENRGDLSVFPVIAPIYQGVGGLTGVLHNGQVVRADGASYVQYDNEIGPVTVMARADPQMKYGPESGDSVRDSAGDRLPWAEAAVTVHGHYLDLHLQANDINDSIYALTWKDLLPNTALTYGVQVGDGDYANPMTNLVLNWMPQNLGLLRRVFALYDRYQGEEDYVVSAWFGGETWQVGLSVDDDFDAAAEISYRFDKRYELLVGLDTGHEAYNGYDPKHFPPPVTEERGPAVEIGLKITF